MKYVKNSLKSQYLKKERKEKRELEMGEEKEGKDNEEKRRGNTSESNSGPVLGGGIFFTMSVLMILR